MNYTETKDEEYILDDGERVMYIRGKFEEALREAEKAARETGRVVTIGRTVGYVEP